MPTVAPAREFLDGTTAIVRGALDAGCDFFAGYPITPASQILMAMMREVPAGGGVAVQGEDEIASIGMCIGAAMCGARAKFLSASFILEEGLPMEILWRIVFSMREAAAKTGVEIVTGDTKVVDRGKGDGVFINTAGIGVIPHDLTLSPGAVKPGDAVTSVATLAGTVSPSWLCGSIFPSKRRSRAIRQYR